MQFRESLNDQYGLSVIYEGEEIYTGETEYNLIEIFRNPTFGKMMMLNGSVQLTERDEKIYHGAMVNYAMPFPFSGITGLIIGGGDGCMAREVLNFHGIDRVDVVELDPGVVEACQKHLQLDGGALTDPRVKVHYGDGFEYVKSCITQYDFIIVDATDPEDNSSALYSREFYSHCAAKMNPGAFMATHCGTPGLQDDLIKTTLDSMSGWFGKVRRHEVHVPSFSFGPIVVASGYKKDPKYKV